MKLRTIFFLAAALAATGCSSAPAHKGDASSLIGRPAPGWGKLKYLENSAYLRLKDLRGQVVVLHWWTDGCPDCVTNLGEIGAIHDRYQGRGVRVIGMYFPDTQGNEVKLDNMREVAGVLGIRFPVALDTDWKALRAYWLDYSDKSVMTPTVVIDRNGIVRAIVAGSRVSDDDARKIDGLVAKLLAEPDSPNP
jgi:alkyl hydroperoxide reductase subunit AhpC